MGISIGSSVGPYELQSRLGAGGMGEVYRARDTRLERTVAIKVVNSQLVASAELRARFEREARVISQLQHPHICVLYDVGRHDGADYLVMEYLEGESLADRLRRGALPLPEVLKIGGEIADALHAAHRAGIVHRDLKPGNIMLTKGGAKLLDFGLARPISAASTGAPGSNSVFTAALTQSSPVSPLSSAGAVLGTVQYMSPEQIAGMEADARSDIFAFGLVLHEMASGKRAFDGKTQASVAGAILAVEPPAVSSLQPTSPPAFDELVRHCLAKDPDERYQSAHDIKLQLAAIRTAATQPMAASARPRFGERIAWGAAALIATVAALIAIAYFTRAPLIKQAVIAQIAPPDNAVFAFWGPAPGFPALSPDGKQLAFVALSNDRQQLLWIRPLNSPTARALPGTEGAGFPFWSPDGRMIAYTAKGNLYRIDAAGGPPIELVAHAGHVSSWSPDGTVLMVENNNVLRVPVSGGTPEVVMHSDTSLSFPQLLPDGKHFLFYSLGPDAGSSGTYAASFAGGKPTMIVRGSSEAMYTAPGYLLFVRDGTLMAEKFNSGNLRLEGDAVPLIESIAVNPIGRRGMFTASANGTLVFASPARHNARLAWYDREGKDIPGLQADGEFGSPSLSPDGRRLAISVADAGTGKPDIWVYDLGRELRTRLTFSADINAAARWLPDGMHVSFESSRNHAFHIYQKAADGTGNATPVLADDAAEFFPSWSADGRYVAFQRSNGVRAQSATGPASGEIWAMALTGDRKPFPVVQNSQFATIQPALSPDAKWLAYVSDESGQQEIYIVPFPHGSGRWQVSSGGGAWPHWRRDGKELFYLSGDNKITSVAIGTEGTSLVIGNPQSLFPVSPAMGSLGSPYDVSADGKRFVLVTAETHGAPVPLTVVVNWPALLKQP